MVCNIRENRLTLRIAGDDFAPLSGTSGTGKGQPRALVPLSGTSGMGKREPLALVPLSGTSSTGKGQPRALVPLRRGVNCAAPQASICRSATLG